MRHKHLPTFLATYTAGVSDDAVNDDVHSAMAAVLVALITTRLLVPAVVLGAVLPRCGAAPQWDGDLL